MHSNYSMAMALMQLPMLLAAVMALVVAVVRWPRHPMTSMLVVIGVGLQILARAGTFAAARQVGAENQWVFVGVAAVGALGGLFLLAAVFTERSAPGTGAPQPR